MKPIHSFQRQLLRKISARKKSLKPFFSRSEQTKKFNSTIFTKIYAKNRWGGSRGEFYSGMGSHNKHVDGYAKTIAKLIQIKNIKHIVEIGCGDFFITNIILKFLEEAGHDYKYLGYDVVKPLICHNRYLYAHPRVKFICKDACVGKIHSGELLIVRQVLQHLNNKSIKKIVDKFKEFNLVLVTEHLASEKYGNFIRPNLDRPTGAGIRLSNKSGVYVDKEPFNCIISAELYKIPQRIFGLEASINTYLIDNTNSDS